MGDDLQCRKYLREGFLTDSTSAGGLVLDRCISNYQCGGDESVVLCISKAMT